MQKFSVKAFLRKDKIRKNGTCPIYIKVTINRKVFKTPYGEDAKESEWNSQEGRYKGSKSSNENSALDCELSKIIKFLREQRGIGTYLNIELVKTFYSTNDKDDFYEYFDLFCKKKFNEISDGTQEHYKLLGRRLKEFKKNILFSDITLSFIERFDKFLRNKSSGTHGTFSRHKNLKAILISAQKAKLLKVNPYENFKLERGKPKYGSLTVEDIKSIQEIDLSTVSNGISMQVTRDMFLFACYTGLRSSDVLNLSKENIFRKHIKIQMQKTKEVVEVPITTKARQIIEKYKGDTRKIFPQRTNQCMNRHLKIIAEICSIDQRVTFHLGRHSCATIMANENINLIMIMKILGHKDVKTTQIYINPSLSTLVQKMGSIDLFN